jgi:uncharacterized membrane-anchored protein YhcB (DUF1043 family)
MFFKNFKKNSMKEQQKKTAHFKRSAAELKTLIEELKQDQTRIQTPSGKALFEKEIREKQMILDAIEQQWRVLTKDHS